MTEEKVREIIFINSHDCGEGLVIKFENVQKVIDLLVEVEEVVEPVKQDYEILSFRTVDQAKAIYTLKSNIYRNDECDSEVSLNSMIDYTKKGMAAIHSVKRLTDGEVFTVGEDEKTVGRITRIYISSVSDRVIFVNTPDCCIDLDHAVKVKQPTILLTTEDGVEITDVYQKVNGLTTEFIKFECNATYTNQPKESKYYNSKYFSTEAARYEYILQNKPVTVTLKVWLDSSLTAAEFFKSKQK